MEPLNLFSSFLRRMSFHGVSLLSIFWTSTYFGNEPPNLHAHDIWIEPSSAVVRTAEPFRCECKVGNCEQENGSFKTSGLLPLKQLETVVYLPSDKQMDLRPYLRNTSNSETEGNWRASLSIDQVGIAWLLQRTEQKMEHPKKIRGRLWAKTPIIISDSLDEVQANTLPVAFSQPFEIVLNSTLLPSVDSKEAIEIRIIKNNAPLANATVMFSSLHAGKVTDEPEAPQLKTDLQGIATFRPNKPGLLLISCHYFDEEDKGSDYDATYYSATMCLEVSQKSRTTPLAKAPSQRKPSELPRYVHTIHDEYKTTTWPNFLAISKATATAAALPLTWSPTENIAWKATLTGHGQSSPVIWKDKIFVTSTDGPNKDIFIVTCFDVGTGSLLWKKEIKNTYPVKNSLYVSRAAPTPVVDAEKLFAFFESGDCVALTHSGELLWHRDLNKDHGPFVAEFGLGASLCQDGERVYALLEHDEPGALVAINKRTGATIWKAARPAGRSWSSPAYFEISGIPQIVVSSNGSVTGYTTENGERLWTIDGLGGNTGTTPIDLGNGEILVGASAGRNGENEQAAKKSNGLVRIQKNNDVWEAKFVWNNPQLSPTWASPITHNGFAYWVNRVGVVSCVDINTGNLLFAERTKQSCWATPLAWKDRIYFFGKDGVTTIIRSGPKFEVLATNEVVDLETFPSETTQLEPENSAQRQQSSANFSGPTLYAAVVADNVIFLRFGNQLIAIGETKN